MDWLDLAIGAVIGLAIGLLLARIRSGERLASLRSENSSQRERLAAAEQTLQESTALRDENEELKLRLERMLGDRRADEGKLMWIEQAQEHLREAFAALASQALTSNADQFLERSREQLTSLLAQLRGDWGTQKEQLKNLVQPLEKTLVQMDEQVRSLEEKRAGAYQSLEKHLQQLGQAQTQLRDTTFTLAQALKSSTVRGRWGELQLRRVLELAGMTAHIDFEEQVTTDEGRPDVIVNLPNKGILPIDAKTPMTSYFAALESDGDAQKSKFAAHAQAMKQRIQELARKEYWRQFPQAPEMVVMFVPSEPSLSAAFAQDPGLLEFAAERNILVSTPLTLLALLRAVAYGWQQQQIADNARQIAQQGQVLYDRIIRFLELFQKTGRGLSQAVDAYDSAVGSIERRLIPSAQRFKELNAATKELPEIQPLDKRPRLFAPEDESE
jgi:DNA recombination protein RmuC